MIRRLLLGTGALALTLSATAAVGGGPASASIPPKVLTGSISCQVVGTLKFSASITNGGSTQVTTSVHASLTNCTGPGTVQQGVIVVSGTLNATSTATVASNCGAIFSGASLPTMTGVTKWKISSGTSVPSAVTITNASAFLDFNTEEVVVGLPTSISSGSFAAEPVSFSGLNSNASGLTLASRCGTLNGVRSIGFGNPVSMGFVTGAVTI